MKNVAGKTLFISLCGIGASFGSEHVVLTGETLSGIAEVYALKDESQSFEQIYGALASHNSVKDPNLIYPGQKLLIPNFKAYESAISRYPNKFYRYHINKDETLSEIAKSVFPELSIRDGVKVLSDINAIKNIHLIYPDQKIYIPHAILSAELVREYKKESLLKKREMASIKKSDEDLKDIFSPLVLEDILSMSYLDKASLDIILVSIKSSYIDNRDSFLKSLNQAVFKARELKLSQLENSFIQISRLAKSNKEYKKSFFKLYSYWGKLKRL